MVDFKFERVNIDDLRMEELYRLRYQVYCTECGFEAAEDHPSGLEMDEFEQYASHFCATVVQTGEIIGTVRIIHNSPIGLPIEHHCVLNDELKFSGDSRLIGEISRLAISKDFRRREIDKAIYSQTDVDLKEVKRVHQQRRTSECKIVAGLYQCIYHESIALGLTHWYAVMVKGLCGLLRRWGIIWSQAGEPVEYHGVRIPYVTIIAENEKQVAALHPMLLEKPVGWECQLTQDDKHKFF